MNQSKSNVQFGIAAIIVAALTVAFTLGAAPRAFAQADGSFGDLGYDNYNSDLGYDNYNSDLGWDNYNSGFGYDEPTYYEDSFYDEPTYYENGIRFSNNRNFASASYPSYSQPSSRSVNTPGFAGYPVQQQQQQQQQQQIVQQPPHITTNTSNTCTNYSCNSINNSINGSFNTNTNTAVVTPIASVPITYRPVQYVYPQPQPVYNNLSCVITVSPNSITNGQAAYLSWTTNSSGSGYGSYGNVTAWLSDGIGRVAPNGSLTVRPNVSTNYTLTVSNGYQTQTCTTYVAVSGTYVSLSQIPYTGFDFGTFGNAIYWGALASFALAAGYLVVYYKGGAGVFVGSMVRGNGYSKRESANVAPVVFASRTIATPAIFGKKQVSAAAPASVRASQETTQSLSAPKDSMAFAHGKDGSAPRIVITRS